VIADTNDACFVISALPTMTVFDKNNLRVQFALEHDSTDPQSLSITLTATNGSALAIQDFVFQAAVPKVKVAVLPISRLHSACY